MWKLLSAIPAFFPFQVLFHLHGLRLNTLNCKLPAELTFCHALEIVRKELMFMEIS